MRDLQDGPAKTKKASQGTRFTPGGPRSADKVKMVAASGETPPGEAKSPKSSNSTALAADYVFPPGGRRHRSRVHRVQPGEQIQFLSRGIGSLRQEDLCLSKTSKCLSGRDLYFVL
jgi:hypothetical protein